MMHRHGETHNAHLASDLRGCCHAGLAMPARADSTQGITDTTITIGNLGPFTGPSSVFTPLNYGPEAYFRYINEQGGVHGRKFKSVFADDSCNEAKGIAAAKKLIFEDKVFMIMANPCSGVAMAIKPMLLQEGVPWIGASANPKISRPPSPGIFHTTYTGIESGRAMASFAMGSRQRRKSLSPCTATTGRTATATTPLTT